MNLYRFLSLAALALHLLWLVWLLLGWLVTRGRPWLRWAHILSLGWGILISIFPWTCPLTHVEVYFDRQAGLKGYQKSFLEHYAEQLIYPDVPQRVLMGVAVAACLLILGIYVRRFQRKRNGIW